MLRLFSDDQQDIYYTPNYYDIFEKNGTGKAMCFVYKQKSGVAIYPFIKNSINNLGYDLDDEYFDIQGAYGYNGILSSNYNNIFRNNFYKEFYEYCQKGNIIAEFNRYNPMLNNHMFADGILDLELNRKTIYLDLMNSYNDIFLNEYSSNNRNMIKKGDKTLYLEYGNNSSMYKIFQSMYKYTMKRLDAKSFYHFSSSFFKSIMKNFPENNLILIAYDKITKKPFGSVFILTYRDKAHYFLSARSSICDNNSVNNFLLDQAIKILKNNKFSYFDLGGGNSLDKNDSLYKFKKKFSPNAYNFYISKKIIQPEIYDFLCDAWERKNPTKMHKYKNYFLKYRV